MGTRWFAGPDGGEAAPDGARSVPGAWLLGLAVAAAATGWTVAVIPWSPGPGWPHLAVPALEAAAFAALLAWFGVAGLGRPGRVRRPMLAGLLLATLAAGWVFLSGAVDRPPVDPARPDLRLVLDGSLPSLLGVAALACYLAAFLGLPWRPAGGPPWPRGLPAVAGLAWAADLAVGLSWLGGDEPVGAVAWTWALGSALWAAALGLSLVLVFVVLDRRAAMARRPARLALAGGLLLVVAWSVGLQHGTGWMVLLLPQGLAAALIGAQALLAGFAGAALLAVAAADPSPPPAVEVGGPGPDAAPTLTRRGR
jgi:hypothetical protein